MSYIVARYCDGDIWRTCRQLDIFSIACLFSLNCSFSFFRTLFPVSPFPGLVQNKAEKASLKMKEKEFSWNFLWFSSTGVLIDLNALNHYYEHRNSFGIISAIGCTRGIRWDLIRPCNKFNVESKIRAIKITTLGKLFFYCIEIHQ